MIVSRRQHDDHSVEYCDERTSMSTDVPEPDFSELHAEYAVFGDAMVCSTDRMLGRS